MNKFGELIKESLLSIDNKKVKKETINDYLNSFTKDNLIKLISVSLIINEEYETVDAIAHMTKKNIVDYILEHLNEILKSYIMNIKTKDIEDLKFILKNNCKELKLESTNMSLHIILFLKDYNIAKVEYSKKNDSVKFFMPKEFIKTLDKLLKDDKLIEINRYNNKVFDYVETVVNTYGIVPFNQVFELFEKQMFNIDGNDFINILLSANLDESINIFRYEDDLLLCNLEFSNQEEAFEFYSNQTGRYKKYSKQKYKSISDCTYVRNLKSYKKLINYLYRTYEGISEDIEYIEDFIIFDYIAFAQKSIEDADQAFNKNIEDIFDIDDEEKERLLKYIKDIFNEFPKWKKRGNV